MTFNGEWQWAISMVIILSQFQINSIELCNNALLAQQQRCICTVSAQLVSALTRPPHPKAAYNCAHAGNLGKIYTQIAANARGPDGAANANVG